MLFGHCCIVVRLNALFNNLALELSGVTLRLFDAQFYAPLRSFLIPDYAQKVSTLYRGKGKVSLDDYGSVSFLPDSGLRRNDKVLRNHQICLSKVQIISIRHGSILFRQRHRIQNFQLIPGFVPLPSFRCVRAFVSEEIL